jgi:hypothetical protein
MGNAIQITGLILALQGVSGAIDHLAVQPFMGLVLNFFNRVVIPRVDLLADHALLTNLALAALGVTLIAVGEWVGQSSTPQPSPDPDPPPAPAVPDPEPSRFPEPTQGKEPPRQPDPVMPDDGPSVLLRAARFAAGVAGWVVAGATATALLADDGLTRTRVVRSAAAVVLAFALALAVGAVQTHHRRHG